MLPAKEFSDKNICYKCVEDLFLRKEIRENGEKIKCSYCNRKAIGFSLGEFADRIAKALLTHYERSADQPSEEEPMLQNTCVVQIMTMRLLQLEMNRNSAATHYMNQRALVMKSGS